MGDSWSPPLRPYGRESNGAVALPSARAAPAAKSARKSALRSDIDRSVDVRARARVGWTGDQDGAVQGYRACMAAGAVGEGYAGVGGGARRNPVARSTECLRRPRRPHRRAQPEGRVVGEVRTPAVAVRVGTRSAVPDRRCACGDGESREVDGGRLGMIQVPGAVDCRGHLETGGAGDRSGDEGPAEQVRLVGADAARGRVKIAGQIARRRRRLRTAVTGRAGGRAVGADLERVTLLA